MKVISNSFFVSVLIDGKDGRDGNDGYSTAVVQMFCRKATTPGRPSGTLTYTFSTGKLSGNSSYFNGWSQSVPATAEGTKLYVTMATARSQSATDDIASSEWSDPVEYIADSTKYASVIIYKRSASQPEDKPADGASYTFATGALTGTLNSWSTAIPATNGNPCWARHATAVSSGTTDTINASEWSGPVKLVEDGRDGIGGVVASVTPASISIPCDSAGKVKAQITKNLTFSMSVGGVACTEVSAVVKSLPDGVQAPLNAQSKVYAVNITASATASGMSGGAVFTVSGKSGGKTFSADCTLALIGASQGAEGTKGDLGKMCYIAGDYSDDIVYTSNSSQTVAVTVKSQSGNTEEVYVLVASTNINSSGKHIAPTDASQSVWEKGQNNYNLIRTTYLFSEFAKLGSGVVSGDWLFSANGTIGGVEFTDGQTYGDTGKPAYMFFDAGSLTGSRTIVSSERQVTGFVNTIGLSAGCKIIRITGRGTSSMTIALKDENGEEIGSQSFTSYQIKDITISKPIDAGTYTLTVVSGSGYVSRVEIVSFAPKLAMDLKTGKTYMKNAYVEGEIVIRNSSDSDVVRINNGTTSKETTETGVTILDAAGLYSRVSSGEGFRLDANNGLQRYNNRGSGEWVPFFAKRRVRVLTGNNPTLDKYDDMVILKDTIASVTLPANPTNGDVITIRVLVASSAYLLLGSSSHFLYTDQKHNYVAINTNKEYSITQNHRYEFVFWDNIWYVNRIEV